MTRFKPWVGFAVLTAAYAIVTGSVALGAAPAETGGPAAVAQGSVHAGQASISPSVSQAPLRSVAQHPAAAVASAQAEISRDAALARLAERRSHLPKAGASPLTATAAANPEPGTESSLARAQVDPQAPGTFDLTVSSIVPAATGSSSIAEPTEAQSGSNVVYTLNWSVAFSSDGGTTWTPGDPYGQYIGPDGFCCDQEVRHDPGRNQFDWSELGLGCVPGFAGCTEQLNVSIDGGNTWCSYVVGPSAVGLPNGAWDQPRLSYTNNYLYITNNIFNASSPFNFITQTIMRWPLDSLQTCSGFGFNFWTGLSGWAGSTDGTTTTAYFGDHRGSNSSFRIWYIPETNPNASTNTSLFFADRSIAAFNFENGTGRCTATPGGTNWTGRSDSRVTAGVLIRGEERGESKSFHNQEVSWWWNAAQGGGFAQPYIEGASFRLSDLAYVNRPLYWNSSVCAHYPHVSSARPDTMGITFTYSTTATNPSPVFFIADDYAASINSWTEGYFLAIGNGGATGWGDYVDNSGFEPFSTGWASAGHTIQGGISTPQFFVVNRDRDLPSVQRGLTLS